MNVVVGNSIKIETDLNIGTVAFKEQFFNSHAWSKFLFSSPDHTANNQPKVLHAFEYLGRNRLILEDDDFLIDTIITNSSEAKTQVQIVVDVYKDNFDFNEIVINIINNADLMNP